jgi:periplasmic copper chaperone A
MSTSGETMRRSTIGRRAAWSGIAAVGLVLVGSSSATAHVTITPSTTDAGATSVLTVGIPHGCDGSATTAISIRVPDGVEGLSAADTDRWAVEQSADGLTYATDEPLLDGEHAEVEFSVRLPDEAGETLVFPVVQRCEDGETAWTEVAEDQDGHDALDKPAPVVVVTAGDAEPTGAEPADARTGAEASPPTEERSPLLTYGALAVGVAGALAVAVVLLRRLGQR